MSPRKPEWGYRASGFKRARKIKGICGEGISEGFGDRKEEGGYVPRYQHVSMSAWYKSFMWMSVNEYVE